jgi:hypothetical protein
MLNSNHNTSPLKRELILRIARLRLEGKLEAGARHIPKELAPAGSKPTRCC